VAAQVMRRILVDYSRARRTEKRGSGKECLPLEEGLAVSDDQCKLISDVDEALQRLERRNDRQSRVVELRFFGGLKEEEIAELLGVSVRTVRRDWNLARAWLYGELAG